MIAGIFHEGSGLGNQLFRYVATRVLAKDKACDFSMCFPDSFKGDSFMKIDKGLSWPAGERHYYHQFQEKKVIENGVDIRGYDPEINFVQDMTVIDGEFQDERYFAHRLNEVREWLKVEPLEMPDDLCVIGFRGGEYTTFRDLFLPKEYWEQAIAIKRAYEPNMRFQVHTDDVVSAELMLKDLLPENTSFIHDIGKNWRSIRYAKHLIIANSSFYIFPALLGDAEHIIAPKGWARHNWKDGGWYLPQNYYKRFFYI